MKLSAILRVLLTVFMLTILLSCSGGGSSSDTTNSGDQANENLSTGSATGGERNPVCAAEDSTGEVQRPQFVMNLSGQTSWYASPLIADLDDDGRNELIAAYYHHIQAFDHGLDIFTVPGSGTNCLLWETSRGGPLRMGQPNSNGL